MRLINNLLLSLIENNLERTYFSTFVDFIAGKAFATDHRTKLVVSEWQLKLFRFLLVAGVLGLLECSKHVRQIHFFMDVLADVFFGVLLGEDYPIDVILQRNAEPIFTEGDSEVKGVSFFVEELLTSLLFFHFV